MRVAWTVLALGLFASSTALAEGLECQANILYGDNPTVRDVATGERVTIVPEPYLRRTQVYQDYSFNIGGSSGGYTPTPIPATATTYEPVPYTPPAAPYIPSVQPPAAPYTPQPYEPAPPMTSTPSTFLDGTSWRLQTVNGMTVTAPATLNFEAGGRYGGRAACNVYGGEVGVFEGFTIDFGGAAATRRACPQLSEEQALFSAYQAATDFRPGREGDTLALLGAGGVTLATFVRDGDVPGQTGASIVGTYTVAGVLIDGVFSTDAGFGTPTMEFLANGQFVGSLGCNNAQGSYTQSGDMLTFGTTAVTARQCLVAAPFEGPILGHLPNIRMIQAIGGGISLRDASGTELIRLTR